MLVVYRIAENSRKLESERKKNLHPNAACIPGAKKSKTVVEISWPKPSNISLVDRNLQISPIFPTEEVSCHSFF